MVEYIESTGTQWINTGFKHNQNTRVVMDAQVTKQPTTTQTTSTALNNTNISSFFTVTNGSSYTWNRSNAGGGIGLVPANIGVHSTTATITLTAKRAISGVKISGAYYTESGYDKITLKVGSTTVLSSVSGTSANAQRWSGSLSSGQAITLTYVKDVSANASNESSTIFYITGNPITSTSTVATHGWLFDGRISSTSASKNLFLLNGTTWNSDYAGSSNRTAITGVAITDRLKVDFNKNVITVNNFTKTWTETAFQSTADLTLLACNTNGTVANGVSAKLYSCKIYDNGTLIRDFYPCVRRADNVVGLWDRVNKTFYTNAGSGTFTAGAEI